MLSDLMFMLSFKSTASDHHALPVRAMQNVKGRRALEANEKVSNLQVAQGVLLDGLRDALRLLLNVTGFCQAACQAEKSNQSMTAPSGRLQALIAVHFNIRVYGARLCGVHGDGEMQVGLLLRRDVGQV